MTGLELIRRIVGLAKVKDITCIENEEARARAERICLKVAKSFILRANQYRTGTSFVETLKRTVNALRGVRGEYDGRAINTNSVER